MVEIRGFEFFRKSRRIGGKSVVQHFELWQTEPAQNAIRSVPNEIISSKTTINTSILLDLNRISALIVRPIVALDIFQISILIQRTFLHTNSIVDAHGVEYISIWIVSSGTVHQSTYVLDAISSPKSLVRVTCGIGPNGNDGQDHAVG